MRDLAFWIVILGLGLVVVFHLGQRLLDQRVPVRTPCGETSIQQHAIRRIGDLDCSVEMASRLGCQYTKFRSLYEPTRQPM